MFFDGVLFVDMVFLIFDIDVILFCFLFLMFVVVVGIVVFGLDLFDMVDYNVIWE